MVNLRGYTKQQKFALLTLATRKTWEQFETDLLYNHSSLETTDVVVDGYAFDLDLWRDNGKPLCNFLIKRDFNGFITLTLTTYLRGDLQKEHKDVHYIKSMRDCECASLNLTDLELIAIIDSLQITLREHTIWRETFEGILIELVSKTPKIPLLSNRNLKDLHKEVKDMFIGLFDLFKGFQQQNKKGLVHKTTNTYGLILSAKELTLELFEVDHTRFLGFSIVLSSELENYEFTLWHANLLKPIVFQDISSFQEYACLLADSLGADLSQKFLMGLETCLVGCGLWSIYNRVGFDLY